MIPRFSTGTLCALLLLFCFRAPEAFASYQTITNDQFYLTTAGTSTPIYTQGGGISKFGNTYYWYGIQYAGMATYYASPTAANASANTTFVAVNCYSSTDMVNWTFRNHIISTSTPNFTKSAALSWVGRMGQVVYNGTSGQYVMWVQYTGTAGSGQACCTGTSPTANFAFNNVQTSISNVYYNSTGDCTIFCDVANGSTPYLVFSDPHGREHLYVSPLSSTFLAIQPATLISEWPQGQEANNMFQRNGLYYACMSNLAGWSYSSAYEVSTPSILNPADYTADATFAGTNINDTYYSQISFVVPVQGNQTTSYILVGDRWSQNDSTYLSAGHGLGFNIMSPVTFNGTTPTFVPMSTFQLDAVTGNWRATPSFAAPTGLTATPGNAQAALSWDASGSATGYTVRRSTASAGPYSTVASGLTSTTDTDSLLTDGTTYYYEVAAVGSSGTSAYTLPVSAIPLANPAPAAPGELIVTTSTSQVALIWDASVSATGYLVERATASSAGPYTQVSSGTGNTFTDTNVTYGPTYYYEIVATGTAGTSTYSPYATASLTGSIIWTGTTSGAWDTATANWLFGSTPALYEDGDMLSFPDSAATTSVTISNTVSPLAAIFSNSSTNYTVGGASISGTGSLSLTGAGTVTLTGSNNYTGTTTIASGATLVVANSNALQGSTLNFTTGSLTFPSSITAATFGSLQGTSSSQNLTLNNASAGAVALTVGGNEQAATYAGNISGAGSVTKSGTAANTLLKATYTGATIVNAGTLTISGTIGNSSAAGAVYVYGTLNLNGATVSALMLENEDASAVNLTGNGAISLTGALLVNGDNSDSDGVVSLAGGTVTVNSVTIGRDGDNLGTSAPSAGSTTDGLYVNGATVSIATTLGVGSTANNSSAQMRVDAGTVTVGGITTVTNDAGSRFSLLDLNGGTFTDNDSSLTGILIGGNADASLDAELLIRGTALVNTTGITLGNSADNGGLRVFTDIAGTTYIGAGGIVATSSTATTVTVDLGSGSVATAPVIAASANWSSNLPMTLTNSSGAVAVTFQTANASNIPENITLGGALSGTGGITKTGGGILTLSGNNSYTGATSVLNGTLELTGSLAGTSSLTVAAGTVFYLAGGSLSVSGAITNNGVFKLSGTPALSQTGSFTNNGVLDLIDGPQSLPAGFVNNGTVLNAGSVQVRQVGMSGSNFALTILGYPNHTYQLQRTSSLTTPVTWTNVGASQTGVGSALMFTDTGTAGTQGFYQIQVSP